MKMVKLYHLQCFMCVIGWSAVLGSPESQNRCHRVKQEFLRKKIGSSHLVPDNPVYDDDISICFNAASKNVSEKTCCTRQMELKYVSAGEKYLRNSIRAKNDFLKNLVRGHIIDYQDRLEYLIQSSANKTGLLLSDLYNIPESEYKLPVFEFYHDIQTYLKQKHVSLYGAVNSFFDNIFPSIYKNTMNDGRAVELTPEQKNCLKEKRQEIIPAPFGFLPYNVSHNLNKALSVAKSYIDVLSLIVEAINTTDYVKITEKCGHAVTRLQFCSHCQDQVDVKPCKGFCLNTMRNCLAQLSVISSDWNGLIRSVGRLQGRMNQAHNAERSLKDLDKKIDEAITHALNNEERINESIQQVCQFQIRLKPAENGMKRTSHHDHNKMKRSMDRESEEILKVMKELITSLKMFDTIADDICEQEIFYDQDDSSNKCWNGLAVDRYTDVVESLPTILKYSQVVDPKLNILRDKLAHMRINLMTRYSDNDYDYDDNSMMADSIKYGSGDSLNGNTLVISDDEDLYGGSGSGEGSGSHHHHHGGHTIDVVIDPAPKTTPGPDFGFPNSQGSGNKPQNTGSHVTFTIATVFVSMVTYILI